MRSPRIFAATLAVLTASASLSFAQDSDSPKIQVGEKNIGVNKALGSKMLGAGPLKNIFGNQNNKENGDTDAGTPKHDVLVEIAGEKKVLLFTIVSSSWSHRSLTEAELKHGRKDLAKCSAKPLEGQTKPGKIALELDANAKGEVAEVRVVENSLGDDITGCLEQTLSKIDFPKLAEADSQKMVSVVAHWEPSYGENQSASKKESGGMGMRGTGTVNKKSEGFGRIHGLGKVDTGGGKKTKALLRKGGVKVSGALSKETVERPISAKTNAFKYCYERMLQTEPKLAGHVTVRLTIGKDGRVSEAKTVAATLGERKVSSCLERVFKRIRFPNAKKETTVSQKLVFGSKTK